MLLVAAALVSGGSAAWAQAPPGLAWEVTAGLDGRYTVGRAVPVRVLADNRGNNQDVEVAISWGAAEFRQALHLPSPSRKQVEFFVTGRDDRDRLNVRLLASDGRELDTRVIPLQAVRPEDSAGPGQHSASEPDEAIVSALRRDLISAATDAPATGHWTFLGEYVVALSAAALLLAVGTRRISVLLALPVVIAAAFAARPATAALIRTPDVRVVAHTGAAIAAGQPFTAVALMTVRSRGTAHLRTTHPHISVSPVVDRPHLIRLTEDGRATLAVEMAVGERVSVAVHGVTAAPLTCDAAEPCRVAAARLGLDLPDVDAVVTRDAKETP